MHTAIIIGSGFSGLCMGIKLKEKGIHDFIILEKGNEVGGTWRENTYPGAECDIPSALYSYSFEPYPYWEYKWSHQPQILEYLKHCARKYGLYKHIQFQKAMMGAKWNDGLKYWMVQTSDHNEIKTRTLITAIGQLHHPSIPEIFRNVYFEGPSWHSAQWNHAYDLKNKTIGVIGNAASAVQFIPEIAKSAKKVFVFQRSANWMLPKQDRLYKNWEKNLVSKFPFLLRLYRLRLWLLGGALFNLMKTGNNLLRNYYQNQCIKYIKKHISDNELVQALTPSYPMGAKRILFSDNYYETLAKENVDLIIDPIESIIPHGIQTKGGNKFSCDALIFATGFKTNPFLSGLNIQGKGGLQISEAWQDGPKNYLGTTIDGFPNLFMMYGPNTNLGHNSIIIMSEAQANYIRQAIEIIKKTKNSSLEVKPEILNSYMQEIQSRLKSMIWNKVEGSWYKTSDGNIPNNWPGRTMEYMRRMRRIRKDDYLYGE